MPNTDYQKLLQRLKPIYLLGSSSALLGWDEQVKMPEKGSSRRSEASGVVSGILHEKFIAIDHDGLLSKLKRQVDAGKLTDSERAVVREIYRDFSRSKKLPTSFVEELSAVTSAAHTLWAQARAKSKFSLFSPSLEKIVELKRKEAKLIGYTDSAYTALLDSFEPYVTTEMVNSLFSELRAFLVPFVRKLVLAKNKPNAALLRGRFPADKQKALNQTIAETMGFDFKAGRMDESDHPFTMGLHSHDVRFTTRYNETDVVSAITATMHETGHALYEQGMPQEHFGTPLAESVSLGLHESQSKIWENLVGRGLPFWKFMYPRLQKTFPAPFARVGLPAFYRSMNAVQPSLIRIEADEVTYNLHIILRFEIEKALIEGSIEVKDLPKIWNAKIKEYLGIRVSSDAAGVLQDVHWSGGMFGYFPTYALGNLYSAQFYDAAKREILNLEKEISRGHLEHLKVWLNKNIHRHGKFYTAPDLVVAATGEPLSNHYWIDYIRNKYTSLYNLK